MHTTPARLHLFEATGVEIEYAITSAATLDVTPAAARFLAVAAGPGAPPGAAEADWGDVTWSNELAAHVVELKATRPAPDLAGALPAFEQAVGRAGVILAPLGATLLPTGAHPWMDPATDSALWDGDGREVYATYDRIFGCSGHGWTNLQSVHLNLPFAGDDEFARLHAAVRLVLPLLPALAASTPFLDGRRQPQLDARLETYRHNQARFPEITGAVIPEPVYSEAEYEEAVYAPIRRAIAPHDPGGLLEVEFLNSRGAIARFDRGAVEIRVIDSQECPRADFAVGALTTAAVRALVAERWSPLAAQKAVATGALVQVLDQTVRAGDRAELGDPTICRHFGLEAPVRAGELWTHLLETLGPELPSALAPTAESIVRLGPLAGRLLAATPDAGRLRPVYRQLADCLAGGRLFRP